MAGHAVAGEIVDCGSGHANGFAGGGKAGQRALVVEGLEDMAHDIAADVYAKLAGQPADAGALKAKVAAAKGGR